MGAYYLVVNPVKREYLNPGRFGEGMKFYSVLCGPYCLLALKYLICDSPAGRWVGDPIVLASDDSGPPNPNGLVTVTPEQPTRNLHAWAVAELADISYRALAELCSNPEVAADLAVRAKHDRSLLVDLGAVIEQYGSRTLEVALEQAVGRPWRKAYHIALVGYPNWRPLPRLD